MNRAIVSSDGKLRCRWCEDIPEFIPYHDREWGFPVADDFRLFEKLSLESFQSGLSWRTILNKREGFRAAFCNFDFNRIADFTERDVARLLQDVSIVRHRGKIEAVINNARAARDLVKNEGSLAAFIWRYEPGVAAAGDPERAADILAKEFKKRGWKFLGPTTVYAFMQAMGLINDHLVDCFIRAKAEAARRRFKPPVSGKPRSTR